jgi:NADH-quinone oxidoreductase subunit N
MIKLVDILFVVGEMYMLYAGLFLLVLGVFTTVRVVIRMMGLVLVFSLLLQFGSFFSDCEVLFLRCHWNIDMNGTFCSILMIVVFMVMLGGGVQVVKGRVMGYEIFVLMYFGLVALILLLRCNDFLLVYICLELYSLCMYVLVVMGRITNFTVEAGLKYFVVGVVSSGLFLLGLLVCYGSVGTVMYGDIELVLGVEYGSGLVLGGFLMSVGIFVKLGVAPFHAWVVDVYEGSVTLVTMYLMVIPKLGLFFLLMKLSVGVFYEMRVVLIPFIVVLALISLLFGTVGGLFQDKFKRLMAYSSIANGGYLLVLLGSVGNLGIIYFYIYIFIYVFMVMMVFSVILVVGGYGSDRMLKLIGRLGLVLKSRYFMGVSLMVGILAMAGFPPFMGFFGKLCVFLVILDGYDYFLLLFVVIASVISAVYYLRVIRMMVFSRLRWGNIQGCSNFMGYIISIFTHVIMLFPVYNLSFIYICMQLVGGV